MVRNPRRAAAILPTACSDMSGALHTSRRVLIKYVTRVLKSDWFALYAAKGTNCVVPGLLLPREGVAPRG